MDLKRIIAELKQQRDRMDMAISALESLAPQASVVSNVTVMPKRRQMSPASRRAISARMKAMWKERKRRKAA